MIDGDEQMMLAEVVRPLQVIMQLLMRSMGSSEYNAQLHREEVVAREGRLGTLYTDGGEIGVFSSRLRKKKE